ncbi:hypothetical protein QBC45DRAFT_415609 [Copromyces sp. CBS 386.78]|nr:hypothetical protein QBC45DRAFT_415609 [Copromyces sp. CBS 386.78]
MGPWWPARQRFRRLKLSRWMGSFRFLLTYLLCGDIEGWLLRTDSRRLLIEDGSRSLTTRKGVISWVKGYFVVRRRP